MDPIDRRRFLAAMTAALAACDRVVVDFHGDGGVLLDDQGNPYIPPITPNADFYVYQYRAPPVVDPATWACRVVDRDGAELGRIDRALLDTLGPRDVELTLQCIGATVVSRRIGNAVWQGLPLHEVLDAAGIPGPDDQAVEIALRGADDYDASVPVSDYLDAPIWLIWGMNGEALPDAHGAPARLLIPGRYGIKNLKWITEIQWFDRAYEGYWDTRGWSHTGAYQVCGFIHFPRWGEEARAPVTVLGSAFAGTDPVVRVQMTADGGQTWEDCALDYAPGANVWALWSWTFRPKKPGRYDIQVRVTTASGRQSSLDPDGTQPMNGYDGGQLLPLTVV